MQMTKEELEDDVLKVRLAGSFDIAGAGTVDMPFSVIAGSRQKVVVDFAEVEFLASFGVRVLVKAARGMGTRGGRLAVYGVSEPARKVLAATGADALIVVAEDEASAVAAVS
jgi:stage II sporulation protein AA (anti-sigma F factor antagonist)